MPLKVTGKRIATAVGTLILTFNFSSCKSSPKYNDDNFFDYLYVKKESRSTYKNHRTTKKSNLTYKSSGREIKGSLDTGYKGKKSVPSYRQTKQRYKTGLLP